MRLFVALELPGTVKDAVAALVGPLKAAHPLRWVNLEGLHLTLVFLGETAEARLPGLRATLDEVARRHRPFNLALGGAGTFGRPGAPRVLWLGVEGDLEAAHALQAELTTALHVAPEHPVWSPHLTLARAGRGSPLDVAPVMLAALAGCQQAGAGASASPLIALSERITFGEVTLFESRGGRYFVLHQARLAPPP